MPHTSEWFTHRLRVRYEETDRMGVVYHANYLTWFEIARTEWTRANGFPYRDIESKGLYLPVVDLSIQYKYPAKYDDEVDVRLRIKELNPLRIKFEYEVRLAHQPETVVVTGSSEHVWVGMDWKPTRISKAMPDVYDAMNSTWPRPE